MNELTDLHIFSFMIAVIAYVYSNILTDGGMILNWLYLTLEKGLPEWLFKPVIGCFKCVSGQAALWMYIISSMPYNAFLHIYFICLTIFLSIVLDKIYNLCRS